jgi:O-antigen ligase
MSRQTTYSPKVIVQVQRHSSRPMDPQMWRVSRILLVVFLAFFVFSLLSVTVLVTAIYNYESIPIQPVAFGIAFGFIVPWRRKRRFPPYFNAAWCFWILFTVGGFLGAKRVSGFGDYDLLQLIAKQWISLVGVPMLAMRTIVHDKYRMLIKLAVFLIAVGAAFAIVQAIAPGAFSKIMVEKGRGAGFWVNPNSCGEICSFGLFLSMICPFRTSFRTTATQAIILGGVAATLSRGGIVILLAGLITYGLAAKQWKTLGRVLAGTVTFLALAAVLLIAIRTTGLASSKRLDRFASFLSGDVGKSQDDRMFLWQHGMKALSDDWILGLGHRAMGHVVPIGGGLGPHNYYIFVWGNSGLMGLIGFLYFVIALFRLGQNCTQTQNRAAICSMSAMLAMMAMVSHAFINAPFFGPLFAMVVLTAYFDPLHLSQPHVRHNTTLCANVALGGTA